MNMLWTTAILRRRGQLCFWGNSSRSDHPQRCCSLPQLYPNVICKGSSQKETGFSSALCRCFCTPSIRTRPESCWSMQCRLYTPRSCAPRQSVDAPSLEVFEKHNVRLLGHAASQPAPPSRRRDALPATLKASSAEHQRRSRLSCSFSTCAPCPSAYCQT
ncbi:hypothetical protein BS50DRAFT_8359 [Corynespora cassiicola Philippines]|uniref:Uncharacterized protein n=1 Tax=Corynespora cassiicola Philippines TaxID=1448308 RepID=A0A2T2P901_CORCC|nr:hypothetical protein BS50DRAFT_8359 [Corynespora cassiicola Philippines]